MGSGLVPIRRLALASWPSWVEIELWKILGASILYSRVHSRIDGNTIACAGAVTLHQVSVCSGALAASGFSKVFLEFLDAFSARRRTQ